MWIQPGKVQALLKIPYQGIIDPILATVLVCTRLL